MSDPFHILEWVGEDVGDVDETRYFAVTGFGRDLLGRTCSVTFQHLPSFLIRSKSGCSKSLKSVKEAVLQIFGENVHSSTGTVMGKPFTGWQDEEEPFLRLVFYNRRCARWAGDLFRKERLNGAAFHNCPAWFVKARFDYETFELDADCTLQALTFNGIPPTGWVRASSPAIKSSRTKCDLHFEAKPVPLHENEIPEQSAPHVVATFDIECFSSRSTWKDQIFPDASVPGDHVTQVVTFFSHFGSNKPYAGQALVLLGPGGVAPERDTVCSINVTVQVSYFHEESALLRAWVKSYACHKVSVWSHFNGLGFDEAYLFNRCAMYGINISPLSHSKTGGDPRLLVQSMESNAYGYNEFATIDLAGVFHLDVYQDIKKNHNLESYSLDSCSEHFLPEGHRKADLKPQEQFDCFRRNDVEKLLEYCVQDVAVTFLLAESLSILPSMFETAAINWVTPSFLVTRGQQVRVYNCIKREIYERGSNLFLRDTKLDAPIEGGYQGATVLEPKRGFYPRAIISLDFASLYPSIMMQYNLSHETWTGSPGDDIRVYKHSDNCGFVRAKYHAGIMPALLMKLKASRKEYKKHMMKYEKLAHEASSQEEKEKFAFLEKVYDAKQKATKVTMNSAYGFAGVANNGKQPCLPLASAVTTIGRQLIEKTKAFCESHVPGSEVIYGDTVGLYKLNAVDP
jgi:DNA polymerase delta subunit 1